MNKGLSEELYKLFLDWQHEYENNLMHDMNDNKAWNALVERLMMLESGTLKDDVLSN